MLDTMKVLIGIIDKLYTVLAQHTTIDDLESSGINNDIRNAAALVKKCGVETGGDSDGD
jgi:hypothetical protein